MSENQTYAALDVSGLQTKLSCRTMPQNVSLPRIVVSQSECAQRFNPPDPSRMVTSAVSNKDWGDAFDSSRALILGESRAHKQLGIEICSSGLSGYSFLTYRGGLYRW